jgi:IclR family acetate operon transcriptional repressor
MVKLVEKIYDIMEHLAEDPERTYMLKEIAARSGMIPNTAGNILRTMVARGYVVQGEYKRGYRLGSMVSFLARGLPHRGDVAAVAEPEARKLAEKVCGTVTVVTMYQGRRFVLVEVDGGEGMHVKGETAARGDAYLSATVRLLLAVQPAEEVRRFVKKHGLPRKEVWAEATTEAGLRAALGKTKTIGAVLVQTEAGVMGFGSPLMERGKMVAALGAYIPTIMVRSGNPAKVALAIKETAREISGKLGERAGKEIKNEKLKMQN